MPIALVQLREADLPLAGQFIMEAQEWAPQTALAVNPGDILFAPNAHWLSALSGDELIGVVGFHSISWPDGSADVSMGVVPKWRRKGLAPNLAHLQNQYGFDSLGLRRLQMVALEGSPSCKIASRVGLKLEGTLRGCRLKGGAYHNASIYALVKEGR